MRTIKFRGKRLNGSWVYGSLVYSANIEPAIYFDTKGSWCHVYPNTVGQFTGLLDKNGKEIYEGDILKVTFTNGEPIYKLVSYQPNNAAFCLVNSFSMQYNGRWDVWSSINQDWVCDVEATVAGNIHDNHELIKEDKQ